MSELDILKGVEIFSRLEEPSLQKLADLSQIKDCQEGDTIFREEDGGDQLYVILEGRVKISKSISPGVDKVLIVVGQGSLFGEIALVAPHDRSATARCQEPCKLLAIGKDNFDQFVQDFPKAGVEILSAFARTLAERLKITTDSYKESMLWGITVGGASQLSFDSFIQDNTTVGVVLNTGTKLEGRILKVDTSIGGCEITLVDGEDKIYVIPYGGISHFILPHGTLKTEDIL